jgi:hypothetical protein
MRYARVIFGACLCAALLAAGCGPQKKAPPKRAAGDPVIATVDGREIRASALVSEYETVPDERRAEYAAHPGELLDFIINRTVIAAEARAQGFDKDPEVVARLGEARRFLLRLMLEQELQKDLAPPSDEELRARYRQDVLDPAGPRIVKQTILYRVPADETTEAQVRDVIRKSLEARLPFGTMAERDRLVFELVPHPTSAASGLPPELVKEIEALKVFAATPVKVLDGKGCIFYKEPLPFEQAEAVVRRALRNEQVAAKLNALVESARATAQISTHLERLTDDAAGDAVVATVNGTAITVADARRALERVPQAAGTQDQAAPLVEHLVREALLVQEAERRGFDKGDEFSRRMQEALDGILIDTMRERVLAGFEISVTDEELRAMAREFAGGDLPGEFIELSYIANPDRAKVEAALADLKAGKDFGEVYQAYSADERQDLGTWSDTTLDTMPEALRAATSGVANGGLTDVFEMDGRFLVVRVIRRPAVVDLEPWRHQLVAKKQDEHFLDWVAEQRAKHRIVVNAERLAAVPLPAPPQP